MSADSGGRENAGDADWILGCEGKDVYAPAGHVGRVAYAVYEPSARWDRPSAIAVKTPERIVLVPLDAVREVRVAERAIVLREDPDAEHRRGLRP